MALQPTVYLFDIDGTLISTGGCARRAMLESLTHVHAISPDAVSFGFAGMTDIAIVRKSMILAGLTPSSDAIDDVLEDYLRRLPHEMETSPDYVVHAGVHDILEKLAPREHSALGLGTGNIERGARIKLTRAGLNAFFPFGGFGCSHELRPELVRIGAERGAKHLGRERQECRVIVIGDTPLDVQAAHAIGADCLAVATGGATLAELADCQPQLAVADLTDPQALDMLLGP